MKINSYFTDFLSNIRLTKAQREDLIKGHLTLRDRLHSDENLKDVIISTFLQGSYRRATAVRPLNGKRADVDIIVVTNIDKHQTTPDKAIEKFFPFVEKHYKDKHLIQGRSIGIELSYVDLDIVITSAPSEVDTEALKSRSVTSNLMLEDFSNTYDWRLTKGWMEPNLEKGVNILSEAVRNGAEWKISPLWIPDREAECWVETHPLEQIRWTRDKNKRTNTHYINVVKALKWWRTLRLTDLKYPKGYPIEHMVGDCCPDNINSVAEGVCLTLEEIVSKYRYFRLSGVTPNLADRGVPSHNVWQRVSLQDFIKFYDHVVTYAGIAREALEAQTLKDQVDKWQKLFGGRFPDFDGDDSSGRNQTPPNGGFTPRTEKTVVGGGRFA